MTFRPSLITTPPIAAPPDGRLRGPLQMAAA
jgi:hypothetical protein